MFPFSPGSAYDSVVYVLVKTKLSEAEAEGKTNHNARSCAFVIGLFHSLLLYRRPVSSVGRAQVC